MSVPLGQGLFLIWIDCDGWNTCGDWEELAARKSLDMNEDGFQNILGEFTGKFHSVRPLAESLRQILFPLQDGLIWTGTDLSSEARSALYSRMVWALEEAMAS